MCGIVLGWSQDFNQVELFEDKLGGSNTIRGWDSFKDWRFASNMISVSLWDLGLHGRISN